jgi:two-component system cell cycle sensor histidine kinase/response regulator CckA
LLESERRFRLVLEKIALAGVMLDREGHITLANDCLLDLTGWTREELLGRSWFELFLPAEIRSEIESLFFNTIEKGRFPKRYENEILTRKGEKRLIAWNNTVVRDETDRIVGVTSVGEDITVRRQVDEKLRQTERKYRELAESLPQVIFEIDSKASLIYINRTGYDLFGYTPEDFVNGIDVLEAFIPEDRERVARDFKLNFQGQRLGRQDYTAVKKDGTKFPVGVHANRVMSGAAATGVRGILIDLTLIQQAEAEKKKLEAQLQQAQKIEAIGVLAGGIAHDFNNILSVIIGNADILEISGGVSQADMPCVQQILTAGDRAKQLVKQILAFSRRGEQQRLLVNLRPVVRETVDFLKSTLPSSIEVSQNFQADAGAAILGDPTQMQQVLMNLCTNGAHAMENRENGVL